MKRVSAVLLVILVVASLAACGGSSEPTPAATTSASGSSTSTAASTPEAGSPTPTESTGASTPGAAADTPTPTPSQGGTPTADFNYGFNVAVRGDDQAMEFNQQTIDAVKEAGFGWVRFQIAWADVEPQENQWDPAPLDRIVGQYAENGVNILATVVRAPEWAKDPSGQKMLADYSDFAGFMHFLAERYKGKIQAYEIWNEQNLAREMGGQVRLEDYCLLLEAGYSGAKQADPNVTIVFGGLTPTGVTDPSIAVDDQQYLQTFYTFRNGAFTKYFDVLGMHVNATNHGPDKMVPDNPGEGNWSDHPSFYFRRAEQLRKVMEEHGDTRPVWITEFGWTTENQAEGYEYGADVTEQEQADYLVGAFEWAHQNWPWVSGMFVWNLNYSVISPPSDEKFPWSVLNADWSPRPAYEALQAMPK